ncbi:hypothetical protein PF002_g27888, partial [Phytophthora fragariae]
FFGVFRILSPLTTRTTVVTTSSAASCQRVKGTWGIFDEDLITSARGSPPCGGSPSL